MMVKVKAYIDGDSLYALNLVDRITSEVLECIYDNQEVELLLDLYDGMRIVSINGHSVVQDDVINTSGGWIVYDKQT